LKCTRIVPAGARIFFKKSGRAAWVYSAVARNAVAKSGQLVEEYSKTVRSLYNAYYREEGLKNPTAEEWAAFAASCNLRDMGTHLCALPTVVHCPNGLICPGCAHAQPKTSAAPIFQRMLVNHEGSLFLPEGTTSQRDRLRPASWESSIAEG
jgi:hypothetical protein